MITLVDGILTVNTKELFGKTMYWYNDDEAKIEQVTVETVMYQDTNFLACLTLDTGGMQTLVEYDMLKVSPEEAVKSCLENANEEEVIFYNKIVEEFYAK